MREQNPSVEKLFETVQSQDRLDRAMPAWTTAQPRIKPVQAMDGIVERIAQNPKASPLTYYRVRIIAKKAGYGAFQYAELPT
jgi:hypothetical protein